MARKKMTKPQLKRAKKQAEKLKRKRGIRNPHALARWQVKQGQKVGKKRKQGR